MIPVNTLENKGERLDLEQFAFPVNNNKASYK